MTDIKHWRNTLRQIESTCHSIAYAIESMNIAESDVHPETIGLVAGLSSQIESIAGVNPAKGFDFEAAAKVPSALTIASVKSEYIQTLDRLTTHYFRLLSAYVELQIDHAIKTYEEVKARAVSGNRLNSNHLQALRTWEFDDWFNGKLSDKDFENLIWKMHIGTREAINHFSDQTELQVLRIALDHAKKCVTSNKFTTLPYTGMSAGTMESDTHHVMGGSVLAQVGVAGLQAYDCCDSLASSSKSAHRFKTEHGFITNGEMVKEVLRKLNGEQIPDTLMDIKTNVLPIIKEIAEEISNGSIPYGAWNLVYMATRPNDHRDVVDCVHDDALPVAVAIFSPIYGYMNKLDLITFLLNGIDRVLPIIMDYGRFNVSAQLSSESNSTPPVDSGASS